MTEAQVLDVVDNVARRLVGRFKFGYHTYDDMMQQARLEAIQGIEQYDGVRPLENFLWTHVHHRLFNFKRNKYARPDKPCLTCPLFDPHCIKSRSECEKFEDKEECDLYASWLKRNTSKKNIMSPTDIESVVSDDVSEDNMRTKDFTDNVEVDEIWKLLDQELDIKLRSDYIKLRQGIKLPKHRKKAVEAAIIQILRPSTIEDDLDE